MAYDDDNDLDVEQTQVLDPNIRKQLREAEKARKELDGLRQELENQKREVLLAKAGIPDTPLGALFRDAYRGEADLEAIKAKAREYGILDTPSQQELPSNDLELEALRRAQGATIGSVGATPDPQQEYFAALANASSVEEVMRIASGDVGRKVGVTTTGMY
jgi:hypothetical protein